MQNIQDRIQTYQVYEETINVIPTEEKDNKRTIHVDQTRCDFNIGNNNVLKDIKENMLVIQGKHN